MIRNLTIENYRPFHYFKLDTVADVNLIVGENNSGKSSLLEAVYLLTSERALSSLIFILNERGEFVDVPDPKSEFGRMTGGYQVSQIFYKRIAQSGQTVTIHSKSDKGISDTLRIVLQGIDTDTLESGEGSLVDQNLTFERNDLEVKASKDRLPISGGLLIYDRRPPYLFRRSRLPGDKSWLLTTNYVGYDELAVLWDKITLTPKEDKVVEALRVLEPDVERISFTSSRTTNSGILLRLKGEAEPVPLGSMGDGMRRILAIIASLVSVDDGTLLVDEIDTGLHHAALVDMWRLVLDVSSRQKAQVFATTHSWDCVKAFHKALKDSKSSAIGCLIRLEKQDNNIKAVQYSATELSIAVSQEIEVR